MIKPLRQLQIPAEKFVAQHPQGFTQSTYRTDPAAEGLLQRYTENKNRDKNEKPRWMNIVDHACLQPVFEAYEGTYRQKPFNTRRAADEGLFLQHPPLNEEMELDANPDTQEHKGSLDTRSKELRIVFHSPDHPLNQRHARCRRTPATPEIDRDFPVPLLVRRRYTFVRNTIGLKAYDVIH